MTTTLQVRMDASLRKDAEAVFKEIGVDATTAVRMFFSKVVRTKSIPFDLNVEKDQAQAHLEDLLLEGLDSSVTPFEDGFAKKIMHRVEAKLKGEKKAKAHA
jgi:addiction module RelB/DinJ family antitoxin